MTADKMTDVIRTSLIAEGMDCPCVDDHAAAVALAVRQFRFSLPIKSKPRAHELGCECRPCGERKVHRVGIIRRILRGLR